jgi:tetratricopeptide (TPR) repeat protein
VSSQQLPAHVRLKRRRVIIAAGACAALGLFTLFWSLSPPSLPAPELYAQARAALQRQEFGLAQELASRIDRDNELWLQARIVAGEAAYRAGRLDDAITFYESVPRDGTATSLLAAYALGEVCRDAGHLTDAESAYRYVLDERPDDSAAHQRLAFVLGVTGRRWESRSHLMFLVRHGSWTLQDLVLLGDLERPMEHREYLERCRQQSPQDVFVLLGLAQADIVDGESASARELLEAVLRESPQVLAAQAMLGELLVDADDDSFYRWHERLPSDADEHPDIWFARGLWARSRSALPVAARCFWETVRRAPSHRRGGYHLGQVLAALGEEAGRDFTERSALLVDISQRLDNVLQSEGRDELSMRRVAEGMESTGRLWEACAWAMTAQREFPFARWPQQLLDRNAGQLVDDTPQMLDSHNLALRHDLSRFPTHATLMAARPGRAQRTDDLQSGSTIRFREQPDANIELAYDNSPDPATSGARMFEETGGGVSTLDFDRDAWPDLYFTQGARWPTGARGPIPSPDLIDRLYRNGAGRTFIDVTLASRLGDRGFSQGPAAGDFNDDGFPDLYVANVGRNRLFVNNGDGTFTDMTDGCGLEGTEWTTSCAIVDLNRDGHPDLFDVNYVTGPNVYEVLCGGKSCGPQTFDGTPPSLFLSRGDGTFARHVLEIPALNAKSLGVIAADIYDRGRPCLFVANDQVANFFLRNVPTGDAAGLRLQDEGFVSGLAFNEHGLPLGSMGIACDDVNGDDRLDFLVTNFEDEDNTLYLQDAPGLFIDATKLSGLALVSYRYVGWGAQFLDADRDGHPDLVLVNGHVDDSRHEGKEYQMRPQFFRNSGNARFRELPADEAGPYFGRKFLGRGLARLDWNRDGRMDFVASNIGDRASLVTNETTGAGHFLNVRLRATRTARDAIGAVVRVTAGDRHWTKQLVGGDGYMATNERVLQFGLGAAAAVRELRVEWPSGVDTVLSDLPVDVTVDLVEGSLHLIDRN